MPFIGNQPALSYTSFAKQDFTTSATTSYTLDNPVANENEIALFINFVRQEPTTAYTASGTSLTLTSATSASDDMYCVFLGKAVQTVNPPSGSVGTAQIADGSITEAKLGSDVTQGITEADMFRLTTNLSTEQDPLINLERVDDATFSKIGTGMSYSSGIFTFPSTGLYLVQMQASTVVSGDQYIQMKIQVSSDSGSSYDSIFFTNGGNEMTAGNITVSTFGQSYVNVTNASTFRLKIRATSVTGGTLSGDTNQNQTSIAFIKLGDNQ